MGRSAGADVVRAPATERPEQHPLSLALSRMARTKLRVGGTDDPQEADADRVAAQVLESAAPPATASSSGPAVGSPPAPPPGGPPPFTGPPSAPPTDAGLSSPGRPLPAGLARDLGVRLGRDLSDVRIHTGPAAATTTDRLGTQPGPELAAMVHRLADRQRPPAGIAAHRLVAATSR